MIVNNSSYLNYLSSLLTTSNDDTISASDTLNSSSTNVADTLPADMDSLNITGVVDVTEVEAEVISESDSKFDWTYNITDDGYLPDFKLGDWGNTSQILFGGNTMFIEERTYAVYLPEALIEKMEADPEFAQEIQDKLEAFFDSATLESGILDDGTVYSVISQQMAVAMDENGNITHTYVRTESYSITTTLSDAANDTTLLDALNSNDDDSSTTSQSLIVKYAFSMYQTSLSIGSSETDESSEESDEEKNSKAMTAIGVKAVITIETAQVAGEEPEIEVRKANGDIIDLLTGKLIQKHAGYGESQPYDTKA